MRTCTYMSALVCSSAFVFGSPYTSLVPAGAPSGRQSTLLCGLWTLRGFSHINFYVEPEGNHFAITRTTRSGTGNYVYKAWTTDINGSLVLNVQDGEKQPEYMLYNLEVQDRDQVLLTSVSALNDVQCSTSEELRNYLSANIASPGFLDIHDKMVFTRVLPGIVTGRHA
ncbi:MAG: hypothetical protein KF744_07825 [Taibaiella sp.]|nr:hypothetical protein [Taibaiella sp.]